jgi:hypothetical protein
VKYIGIIAVLLLIAVLNTPTAHAESLRMQPLEYRSVLKAGERQKGFVDITNPTAEALRVAISVQAFRQIDDNGTLQFYDDPQIKEGLIPDLSEFDISPNQTMRLYFIADGTKLPSGDIFAALFATIQQPEIKSGVMQTIRIGTLYSLVNGTPGPRSAEIMDISVGFFQFDTKISGTYSIKNTADPKKATGFYPETLTTIQPFHIANKNTSSLIYAGRTRTNSFTIETARLGFYNVAVSYGDSAKSRWVFIASGAWRWVMIAVFVAGGIAAFGIVRYRRQQRRRA